MEIRGVFLKARVTHVLCGEIKNFDFFSFKFSLKLCDNFVNDAHGLAIKTFLRKRDKSTLSLLIKDL